MGFFLLLAYLVALFVRIDELFPALAPYRIMLCLGIAASVFSLLGLLAGRRPTFRAHQLYIMLGLTAMILVSNPIHGWFGGTILAWEEFGATAIVFFLITLNVTSLRRISIVATLLVMLSLFLAIQGIVSYHFGYRKDLFIFESPVDILPATMAAGNLPPGVQLSDSGPFLPRIRALGYLNDPNDLAQALLMVLPFLYLAWRRRCWFRNLFVVCIPMALLGYGVYLTHSRGASLAIMVLVFLSLRRRLSRSQTLLLTAVAAVAMIAINVGGGRGFMDEDRIDAWATGLDLLKSSPLWGVGFKQFTESNQLTAHNSFVLCFAELGLIGYFLWLSLLSTTFLDLRSLERLPGDEPLDTDIRRWARGIFLSLSVFLAAGFFLSRTYIMPLYVLLALGVALMDLARRADKPLVEFSPIRWATRVGALELASIIVIYVVVKLNPPGL